MFDSIRKYRLVFLILIEVLLIYLIYMLGETPCSSGYQVSIYADYPNRFWLIYFLIYLFSLSTVVYSIFIKRDKLFFYSSLFNLLILNLVIFLFPFFRGYLSVDLGDSTNHLAYVKDIIDTSHLAGAGAAIQDAYPTTHIVAANIMLITDVRLETIGQITPVLYHIVFILFTYLLGRELFKSSNKAMLLLLFALLPILRGYYLYPSLMFFYLVPMLLYAFIKARRHASNSFTYVTILLVICLPFTHPASSLLLIMLLAVLCLIGYVLHAENLKLRGYGATPLIFVTVWLVWTLSLGGHVEVWFREYLDWFSNIFGEYSYYEASVSGVQEAQLSLGGTIILYIKKYGPMHLLFGMAALFASYFVYDWIKRKTDKLNTALSLICLVYVALFAISFFFTILLLGARIETYTLLIAILVCGGSLFGLVSALKTKIGRVIPLALMIVLLFSVTSMATFGFYNSPFTRSKSAQVTYMEVDSMDWLLQTRNKGLPVEGLSHREGHLAVYLLGYEGRSLEPNLRWFEHPQIIPSHFGYDEEALLGKTLQKDCYLIINKRGELISTKVFSGYEEEWAFHPDDYLRLEHDESLGKIFHNGEMKIFYVSGGQWSEAD